uniref:hypothetical protein n=1 Tax=Salmonella sp. s55004 TaxID=3159675 RepID=UPI00398187ED
MEDTVFVSGLPKSTTEEQLAEFFGAIGVIKIDRRKNGPKIWMYKGADGEPKGEATVTFDDQHTAKSAIYWFNGKDFHGSEIK